MLTQTSKRLAPGVRHTFTAVSKAASVQQPQMQMMFQQPQMQMMLQQPQFFQNFLDIYKNKNLFDIWRDYTQKQKEISDVSTQDSSDGESNLSTSSDETLSTSSDGEISPKVNEEATLQLLEQYFTGIWKDKEDQELFEKFLSENQEKSDNKHLFLGYAALLVVFKALFTDENNIHKQLQEKDLTKNSTPILIYKLCILLNVNPLSITPSIIATLINDIRKDYNHTRKNSPQKDISDVSTEEIIKLDKYEEYHETSTILSNILLSSYRPISKLLSISIDHPLGHDIYRASKGEIKSSKDIKFIQELEALITELIKRSPESIQEFLSKLDTLDEVEALVGLKKDYIKDKKDYVKDIVVEGPKNKEILLEKKNQEDYIEAILKEKKDAKKSIEELVQNGKQIIKQLIKEDLRGAF